MHSGTKTSFSLPCDLCFRNVKILLVSKNKSKHFNGIRLYLLFVANKMAEFRGCIRAAEDLLGPGARGTATMNFPNAVFMVQSIYDCMQTCLGVKICAQQKKINKYHF